MTLAPEELDPNSELRRKARANVATFEPLTGEELAEISRLFAGTNVPGRRYRGAAVGGWARTPTAVTNQKACPRPSDRRRPRRTSARRGAPPHPRRA